jgi:uncharacterized membrane protein
MLSVTVLPAELHALSGVPALLVFKVVYPAVSALFAVAVFGLARRVLPRRWALTAVWLVVAQSAFFQELPGLARQEIALLLFVAVVAAVLDDHIPWRSQWILIALFGLAMAVSHYSTTYMAIGIFGLTLLLQWVTSWFRQIPRVSGAVLVAFVAALAGSVVWYGPVTHSASNVTQFAATTQTNGLDLLPNQGQGRGVPGLLSAYLRGTTPTPLQAARYEQIVHEQYALHVHYVTPLPDSASRQNSLRDAAATVPRVRWRLGFSVLEVAGLVVQQLANVLGAVGALMMVRRRRSAVLAREIGLVSLATLLILGLIRLSGTLAYGYNPGRAFVQGTVVVGVTLSWSMHVFAGGERPRHPARSWRGRTVAALVAATVSLGVLFASTAGLTGVVLGGGTPTNLANSGTDFDHFYMSAPELAAARWLGTFMRPGQLVYADRYGQLPFIAMNGLPSGLKTDVTPMTIDQHAWIYASRTNVVDRLASALFNEHPVSYIFPFHFLDDNFDTVYTNGTSEVFHR